MTGVQQRDIVELNYELPNGKFKVHPALIIPNGNVLETEDIFYAVMISSNPINDEFTFELDSSMLTKPFVSQRGFRQLLFKIKITLRRNPDAQKLLHFML